MHNLTVQLARVAVYQTKPRQVKRRQEACARQANKPGCLSIAARSGAERQASMWHVVPKPTCVHLRTIAVTVSAGCAGKAATSGSRAVDGVPAEPSMWCSSSGAVKFDGVRSFTFVK
jgi:hypothetical protein